MMLPRHSYRSHSFTFAERRLCFEGGPEVRKVTDLLKNEQADLDALQNAIEASRQAPNAQPLIPAVMEELNRQKDGTIKNKLEALSKRASDKEMNALKSTIDLISSQIDVPQNAPVNPNAVKVSTEKIAEDPKTFLGKMSKSTAEIKKDFLEGSKWTKIGYVAGGVFGFLAVRYLWRKMSGVLGIQKKGGILPWLLGLGGAIVGFIGIKALLDKFRNPASAGGGQGFFDPKTNNPFIPDSIEPTLDKGMDGAGKGANQAMSILGTAGKELLNHENIAKVFSESATYSSDVAFTGALLAAIIKDGFDVVVDEMGVAIYSGSHLVPLTGTFAVQAWDYFYNKNMTPETTGDFVATYIEGTLVYASSLAALKMVTLNRVGKNANFLWEAGLWPVYTVKRGTQAGLTLVRGASGLAFKESASRLTLSRMDAALTRNVRLRAGRRLTAGTAEGLNFRYEFAQDQQRLLESAQINSVLTKNEDAMKLFKTNLDKSIDEFGKYLKGMKAEEIPSGFLDAFHEVTKNKDVSKLTRDQLAEILKKMDTTRKVEAGADLAGDAVKAGAHASGAAGKTVNTVNAATSTTAKAAGGGDEGADVVTSASVHGTNATRTTGTVADLTSNADDLKFADTIGDALEETKLDDFMKKLDISDELRSQVLADPRARSIVKGAAESGDAAEVTRAGRMVQRASNLRLAAIGGGMALSTLGVWMAYSEFQENKEKMTQTTNPELQKIYAQTNMLVSVDGGVQAVGIAVDGLILYQAATGHILCAAAAPIGFALLPITAGVMAVREGYRQSAHLQEYFATTDRDLAKMPPHQILAHIEGSKPMENMNGMQSFISMLGNKDAKTQQEANLNSRVNGYRAYFAQSAEGVIPHPTAADVRSFRNVGYEEISDEDVKNLYKDWLSQYVLEAESSIRQLTQGQFHLVDTDILNQVRAEAFAKWASRRWGQKTDIKTKNGQQIEYLWRQDIVAEAKDPDHFVQSLPTYILRKTEVADALAFAERELASMSYLSASEKQMIRANLLYGMRKELQEFTSRVDKDHATSDRAVQYLVGSLKESTRSSWFRKEQNKSVPMTSMMKELVNTPMTLSGQAFEQFLAKYPLRQISSKPRNIPLPPENPSYPTPTPTNAA